MRARSIVLSCLAVVLALLTVPLLAADDGAALYKKNCVKCHGDQGKGDGPAAKLLKNQSMGDLSSKAEMSKLSDDTLHKMVAEGGQAVGKSKVMPAHKDKLSEAEIKAVIAYIKTLQK
ncbi:MAG: cytochrome c [Acidobacteria bacterium]|nr:cytochrome c [Acidobacteriota bacterium]